MTRSIQHILSLDADYKTAQGLDAFDRFIFTGELPIGETCKGDLAELESRVLSHLKCLGVSPEACLFVLIGGHEESEHFPYTLHATDFLEALNLEQGDQKIVCLAAFSDEGLAFVLLSDNVNEMHCYGTIKTDDESEQLGLLDVVSESPLLPKEGLCLTRFADTSAPLTDLLRLIKVTFTAYNRYLPLSSIDTHWDEALEDKAYARFESTPWFSQTSRKAGLQLDNQILLVEEPAHLNRPNGFLAHSTTKLFLFSDNTVEGLLNQINSGDFKLPLYAIYSTFDCNQPYRFALVADSIDSFNQEIELAQKGIPQALQDNATFKTPRGSYFTAAPVAGELCFLYPGIGASYLHLGTRLFQLFPSLWQSLSDKTNDFAQSLQDEHINPKSLRPLSFKETKQKEIALKLNLPDSAECGVAYSCIFTAIFRDVFGLKPDFALGYSMGEVSMFAALDIWEDPQVMSQRLREASVFSEDLSGELNVLKTLWGEEQATWQTLSIRATKEEVKKASVGLERVFCTIVNTPDNLLVAGHPKDCAQVVGRLGVKAMDIGISNIIHSAPAREKVDEMKAIYRLPVKQKVPTKLVSSSCYLPVPQFSEAIAHSVATCLSEPVDFPKLVKGVYDQGARFFLEMGPSRSLTNYVGKTLKQDDHVSVSVNAKGTADDISLIRALAELSAHGVKLNLQPLYEGSLLSVKG